MAPPAKKFKPRLWNILIHRYLGYFFLGLTVVYAISGLAVNHIEDWNPNYITEVRQVPLPPLAASDNLTATEAQALFAQLGITKPFNPENVFYPDERQIQVILAGNEKLTLFPAEQRAEHEVVKRRPVLHAFNFIHLNSAKKLWTWYADFYAISLLIIAITGLFMKKGKEGIWGKGGILALAGMVVPVILMLMYYE